MKAQFWQFAPLVAGISLLMSSPAHATLTEVGHYTEVLSQEGNGSYSGSGSCGSSSSSGGSGYGGDDDSISIQTVYQFEGTYLDEPGNYSYTLSFGYGGNTALSNTAMGAAQSIVAQFGDQCEAYSSYNGVGNGAYGPVSSSATGTVYVGEDERAGFSIGIGMFAKSKTRTYPGGSGTSISYANGSMNTPQYVP